MSSSHHGDGRFPEDPEMRKKQDELFQRFIAQAEGKVKRQYSMGRISPDDDGDLAMAFTADKAKNIVVLRFGKPVEWIGMGPAEVNGMINLLVEKMHELGEPVIVNTHVGVRKP